MSQYSRHDPLKRRYHHEICPWRLVNAGDRYAPNPLGKLRSVRGCDMSDLKPHAVLRDVQP